MTKTVFLRVSPLGGSSAAHGKARWQKIPRGGYGTLIRGEFKMAPLDGRVLAYTDIMIRGEYKEAQA